MENRFYIYVYLDPRKSGKYNYGEYHFDYEPFYVGKGTGNRMYNHLCKSINYNKIFKNKIKKIQRICNCNPIIIKYQEMLLEQVAFDIERSMVKTIGRSDLKLGPLCNLTDAGEGISGYHHIKETKEKIRKSLLGKKHGSMSEETKEKIRKVNLGIKRPCSEETKRKISINRKGKFIITDSWRLKQSISHRKIYYIKDSNGKIHKIDNLPVFCKINNINYGNMSSVLNNNRRSCGGFTKSEGIL